MSRYTSVIAAAVLLLATVTSADAGTIKDTFGTGDSYNNFAVFLVGGSGTNFPQDLAAPFTPSGDTALSSVEFALQRYAGTNSLQVLILGDTSGVPDASNVLESWTLSSVGGAGVYSLSSSGNPTLSGGTQYWVTLLPGGADTDIGWFQNDQGFKGIATDIGTGWSNSPTSTAPAYRVSGTSLVPIPAAAWLGFGMLGLLGAARRLRRKRA